MGQFSDKTYGIRKQKRYLFDHNFSNRRINRGKKFVFGKNI